MQAVKDEAQSKTNEVSQQLRQCSDDLAATCADRDKLREMALSNGAELKALGVAHSTLTAEHAKLSEDHSTLSSSNSTLQQRFTEMSRQNAQDADLIATLKGKMQEASATVADASREVDERRSEAAQLKDHIDRLNEEKSIILKGKHAIEQANVTAQAENDLLAKKNKALESEMAAVREEKRRIERQLSLTVTGMPPSRDVSSLS